MNDQNLRKGYFENKWTPNLIPNFSLTFEDQLILIVDLGYMKNCHNIVWNGTKKIMLIEFSMANETRGIKN